MPIKSNRFVPRLQALDDRALPSVSYDLQGTFLFVHGDAAANQITISDDGTATGVSVTSDDGNNWSNPTGATITHVFVDTQDGDDVVTYNLTGPLGVNRLVDVDLGLGADSFTANISGTSLAQLVNLDISARGGDRGGRDLLVLNAEGVSTDVGSVLNVNLDGAGGKDSIVLDYTAGIELGTVTLTKDQKH
jgi:hypothetical protein